MATPKQDDPQEDAGGEQSEDRKLLADQRDANEQLLLAGIRAQEAADEALAARTRAEDATRHLEAIERELRGTAEFREQLLAIVGHDLRNPLGAITIAAGLLLRNVNLSEADARLVARIINSSHRMTRMIAQLLDFTRTRLGGGLSLFLKPIDLAEISQNVVAELELATAIPLRCEIEGELSGTWDADRLHQVISNLAGNAIGYATAGTPVVVKGYVDGAEVVAEVSNQGSPISPDVLPVIFEPFKRAKQEAKSSATHLGLGLYIANQIVLAHGGTLAARSSHGTTTFTMRLPRVASAGSAERRSQDREDG
jgi:signal transduction histidine kinase